MWAGPLPVSWHFWARGDIGLGPWRQGQVGLSNPICSLSERQIFSQVQLWLMPCQWWRLLSSPPWVHNFPGWRRLATRPHNCRPPGEQGRQGLTSFTCSYFLSSLICPPDPCSQTENIQSKGQAPSSYLGIFFFQGCGCPLAQGNPLPIFQLKLQPLPACSRLAWTQLLDLSLCQAPDVKFTLFH